METKTKTTVTQMKFKGTKNELVEILNGLYSTGELSGKEFAIISSKNINIIKAELEDIEELAKPSEAFLKLAEKVKAIQQDEDSQKKIDALEAEEPELVEARKAQLAAVQEMLLDETELELIGISTSILPEEIKSHQVGLLTKLLID
jgi:hypothetical protein